MVVSPSLRQSGFLSPQTRPPSRCLRCRLPARDADRGRTRLGRIGGVAAGRSSRHAARPVAAPRGPGGADRRRGISRPRRAMGDDLADARRSARCATDPAVDPSRRQRRVPPRLVLGRRLGARANHRRSMPTHFRRASRRRAHPPRRALYRQEYFGAFVSAPGSVFDAEVLAHMFGDDGAEEPDEPASIVQGALVVASSNDRQYPASHDRASRPLPRGLRIDTSRKSTLEDRYSERGSPRFSLRWKTESNDYVLAFARSLLLGLAGLSFRPSTTICQLRRYPRWTSPNSAPMRRFICMSAAHQISPMLWTAV